MAAIRFYRNDIFVRRHRHDQWFTAAGNRSIKIKLDTVFVFLLCSLFHIAIIVILHSAVLINRDLYLAST